MTNKRNLGQYLPEDWKTIVHELQIKEGPKVLVDGIYPRMTGGVTSAAVLAQIVYWSLPGKGVGSEETKLRVVKGNELWLSKTHHEFWLEIGISRQSLRTALDRLTQLDLISRWVKKYDRRPTNHLRVNWDTFFIEYHNHYKKYLEELEEYKSKNKTYITARIEPESFLLVETDQSDIG